MAYEAHCKALMDDKRSDVFGLNDAIKLFILVEIEA